VLNTFGLPTKSSARRLHPLADRAPAGLVPSEIAAKPRTGRSGRIVGVNIASLELRAIVYAIPADGVQMPIREMRKR
jgi:hypothetical protein